MKVTIRNLHRKLKPNLEKVSRPLSRLKQTSGRGKIRRVDVYFSDDANVSELSARFRGERKRTDVLSFTYGDFDLLPYGEIVISIDTAKRQANERRIALENELLLLSLHGLLHVAGFRDDTLRTWNEMRKQEFENLVQIL